MGMAPQSSFGEILMGEIVCSLCRSVFSEGEHSSVYCRSCMETLDFDADLEVSRRIEQRTIFDPIERDREREHEDWLRSQEKYGIR